MSGPAPIPTPWRARWVLFRVRVLPGVCFAAALLGVAILWKDYAAAPTLVGQVEALQANVSCYKPGMLAELNVNRFQKVKAGDAVGQVLVTDPKILAASLAVIQADIDMLRATMQPVAARQRTAMDYSQLRLDWMRQRAQLAMARANLQFAQAESRRNEELFKEKIVSQSLYDQSKANEARYQNQVDELSRLVEEQTRNFDELQLTNSVELTKVTEDPLRTAIAAQESKLRLTEAELSPITLRAPVDGMVDIIYRRAGEAVTAGEPILAIAPAHGARIVGYLRPPLTKEPRRGQRVEIRTRGTHREAAPAQVIEVGTQYEPIAPALEGPVKAAGVELGLPIGISLPADLNLRPGELVDLVLLPDKP